MFFPPLYTLTFFFLGLLSNSMIPANTYVSEQNCSGEETELQAKGMLVRLNWHVKAKGCWKGRCMMMKKGFSRVRGEKNKQTRWRHHPAHKASWHFLRGHERERHTAHEWTTRKHNVLSFVPFVFFFAHSGSVVIGPEIGMAWVFFPVSRASHSGVEMPPEIFTREQTLQRMIKAGWVLFSVW